MNKSFTYKSAGVDVKKSDDFTELIKQSTSKKKYPGVISGIGGFASLFSIKNLGYKEPVIASCTDGVGTKILIAKQTGIYNFIGIDLVAMCVNDLLCHGAKPLFFLDYYATGKLDIQAAGTIIKSIIKGCEISDIPLLGGETAEMPGLYDRDEYDLAGFAVGIAEKSEILPKTNIKSGDRLIALKSSGLHSNGFSLVRKVFDSLGIKYSSNSVWQGKTWADILLEPTMIYTNKVICVKNLIKAAAHITGGGILANLQRVIPKDLQINLNYDHWPELFCWLMQEGQITKTEMIQTFNCGIGMILVVSKENFAQVLHQLGNIAFVVGNLK